MNLSLPCGCNMYRIYSGADYEKKKKEREKKKKQVGSTNLYFQLDRAYICPNILVRIERAAHCRGASNEENKPRRREMAHSVFAGEPLPTRRSFTALRSQPPCEPVVVSLRADASASARAAALAFFPVAAPVLRGLDSAPGSACMCEKKSQSEWIAHFCADMQVS